MAVLDSPLNKAGRMKVYIHTEKNVLIEVSSKCRIPRTFKRFSGLMGKGTVVFLFRIYLYSKVSVVCNLLVISMFYTVCVAAYSQSNCCTG